MKLGLWTFIRLGGRTSIADADLYILGAWTPAYNSLLEDLHQAGKRIGVLWTSSSGEIGFEGVEADYLAGILRDPRISFVWFGHKPLALAFPQKGWYAPYPFAIPDPLEPPAERHSYMTLFCPEGPKKNTLNQLLAALLVQRQFPSLSLETNVAVPPLLREAGLLFKQHGWLKPDAYREMIRHSRLNFACSWAETLHYQSLEAAVYYGVPSIGSPAIPWLPDEAMTNPNRPDHIAAVGALVLYPRDPKRNVGELHRLGGQFWAQKANKALKAQLEVVGMNTPKT